MRSMRGIERRWKKRWKDRNGKRKGDEENEDMERSVKSRFRKGDNKN